MVHWKLLLIASKNGHRNCFDFTPGSVLSFKGQIWYVLHLHFVFADDVFHSVRCMYKKDTFKGGLAVFFGHLRCFRIGNCSRDERLLCGTGKEYSYVLECVGGSTAEFEFVCSKGRDICLERLVTPWKGS